MLDLTSCSKDEENGVAAPTEKESGGKDDDGNKDSGKEDDQSVVGPEVVVTVDDSGKADGGHRFQKIDETSFYIDDIKYTAEQGDLVVAGYNEAFFKGAAVIISTLKYQGRTMDVTSIKNEAFKDCKVMTSCVIGNKVTSIGDGAFSGCSSLTLVTINSNSVISHNYDYYSSLKEVFGEQVKEYILGNGVTSIGEKAFYGCSGLTSVTIPNSVTSIENYTFSFCSGLTSVTIPSSVTSIGENSFAGCSGLASIMVENGNSKYDSRENCNAIIETATNTLIRGCKNTIIPNSVTSIGEAAFSGCSGLTSLSIPNSVTSIGYGAFDSCSGLTSVSIPNSVMSIGSYAFYGCSGLTSVTIPSSVTSIGACAFYGCSSLSTVTIGSGVTNIGDYAFSDCSGLQYVYCYAVNPPLTASNAFYDIPISSVTLHVPAESLDAYKSEYPWRSFFTGIQKSETVTWNFQVQDMQLAQEMGLKIAYYDADGSIKKADVTALNNGKFSVKVVADATKEVKMGFAAVWFLTMPAAEYTADSYNFINAITPTIVRTFPDGDRTVQIGVAPYVQTGIYKAQTGSSLQKRINAGYNYVSTFFGYSYSDGSISSISDKELLQALGAVKNSNN